MKLVIVVPCYNEEEVLVETTRQLSSVVDELLSDGKIGEGKILYVDDGSRDRTWELIRGFSETHPSVSGLKLAHNVGHQQALWAVWSGRPRMRMQLCPLMPTCRMTCVPSSVWWMPGAGGPTSYTACAGSVRRILFLRKIRPWLSIS